MQPGAILLVTGPKGSGKTAFCQELARMARRGGLDVAGVLTVKEAGSRRAGPARRERLLAVDLRTGRCAPLAVWGTDRWEFRPEGIRLGTAALEAACPCDLLVVDELGPLELKRDQGWTAAIGALARGRYRLAVVSVRLGLAGEIEARVRAQRAAAATAAPEIATIRLHDAEKPRPPEELAATWLCGPGQGRRSA